MTASESVVLGTVSKCVSEGRLINIYVLYQTRLSILYYLKNVSGYRSIVSKNRHSFKMCV